MKKLAVLLSVFLCTQALTTHAQSKNDKKLLGMYVHQHWSYNHPYAARTWTLDDWRGYIDGIHKLGYNFVLIWPMLETMPEPLTPSDKANLEKIAKVIDMVHNDYNMKVSIVLCPNVSPKSEEGRKYTFEQRPFFHTDDRVDPGDPVAFGKLMDWREKLFAPLAKADGLFIIDSDPGGYPNSTNMEFVYILGAHRRMLDKLRPGIEIDYWALHGWESYSRFYFTGEFKSAATSELRDAIALMAKQRMEPWGIASGRGPDLADSLNMSDRVLAFPYGAIEAEPSFPFTLYNLDRTTKNAKAGGKRGVLGNSQTHIVQLPNTFAFARAAQGLSTEKSDYIKFANDIIPGHGEKLVEGWEAMQGSDATRMKNAIKKLEALGSSTVKAGPLKGLVFGNLSSYINDLVLQLKMTSTLHDFKNAVDNNSNKQKIKSTLSAFTNAADAWQKKTGYSNSWSWPAMTEALTKLNSPVINATLATHKFTSDEGATPFDKVKNGLALMESYTTRLINSMKEAVKQMD